MANEQVKILTEAMVDSWDRNNRILLNLLHAIPDGGLQARAMGGCPSVSEMFTHMNHERMISVFEEAPEFAGKVPEKEWMIEHDRDRIAQMLIESANRVRDAVKSRLETGKDLKLNYDHPMLLIQLLIFHEGYHHGQIKLALKVAGSPIDDDQAGPLTWDIWRRKNAPQSTLKPRKPRRR